MRLWIPGSGGVLGTLLQALCQQQGICFVPTTRADIDVTDISSVFRFAQDQKVTHIINCAAYTAVDLAEKEKEKAFAVNALGPENLGKVSATLGLGFVHLSTNFIFDGQKEAAYEEADEARPLSVYGESKWEGEKRVLEQNPHACVLRTSWVFGKEAKNFVSSILETLKKETVVRAADDQVGRVTYGKDLAEAALSLLSKNGVYHFANLGSLSRFQIACGIKEEAEKRGIPLAVQEIIPVSAKEFSMPAKRPQNGVLSTQKIEKLMEIRSWKNALTEYLDEI
jgi:dTDP-4-dehydrorhamnose reductase